MALCVVMNPDGTLVATGEAVEACTGYVLQSGSEYAAYQNSVGYLTSIFEWPEPSVLSGWVVASFGFILVMNAVGSITGSVVKMLSTDRH